VPAESAEAAKGSHLERGSARIRPGDAAAESDAPEDERRRADESHDSADDRAPGKTAERAHGSTSFGLLSWKQPGGSD
jgi:hypothetical protein